MTDSQKLIIFAKAHLETQPFDIVHDLEHHQLVVNNCKKIIGTEKLEPDFDVMMTAAWWHDVEKNYETNNSSDTTVSFFHKAALEQAVDETFALQCAQVIAEHSFSETQTLLESKILFDADKIEYVNVARIRKLIDDIESNPSKQDFKFLQTMHDIWIFRIDKVAAMMHFEYSKKIYSDHLSETKEILQVFQTAIKK